MKRTMPWKNDVAGSSDESSDESSDSDSDSGSGDVIGTDGKEDPVCKYGLQILGPIKGLAYLKCVFCGQVLETEVYGLEAHLVGNQNQVKPCTKVPKKVKEELTELMKKGNVLNRMTRGQTTRGQTKRFAVNIEDVNVAATKNLSTANEFRNAACLDIGRFFIDNGIPFHAANSPSFMAMCWSIGNYGRGLTPPAFYELTSWILGEENKSTDSFVNEVKKTWIHTGVSIISDEWKDIRGRLFINFLVNNPHGTVYLKTIDASNAIKTNETLFRLLDDVVHEVGEEIVIQVVTNNTSDYVAAGKMLMAKRQRLWWTPCATHCIELMLEKIGELPRHKYALRNAKKVSNFIYNHSQLLGLMRWYINKDLVRAAATRFVTAYLTLQHINDVKQPLQAMVTSREWCTSTWAKKSEGKQVKRIILSDENFWGSVAYAVKSTKPLFSVLRMVDSEKMPGMGFLYGSIEKAKQEIQENLGNSKATCLEIMNIIDAKWENQMHQPLQAAACYLNPRFQYDSNWKPDVHVKTGLFAALDKLIPDDNERELADLQLDNFRLKKGLFGMAQSTTTKRAPATWWANFGDECPELRNFAVKVLGLTCSFSACKRNWSAFRQIHTKKRNRLTMENLNSLAYVMYNKKLKERYFKKMILNEDEDPLLLDRCPSDDEWVAGLDDDQTSGANEGTQTSDTDTQGEMVCKRANKKRKISHGPSASKVKLGKRKGGAVIDFEALKQHGYKGGLSVLKVPPPKVVEEQNWSWSTGKEKSGVDKEPEESFEERQRTREALNEGEKLLYVKTRSEREEEREREREKKNLSFSQKEKRKRDLGQASRGKSYVEEEKRLLRESGVYSGFDS